MQICDRGVTNIRVGIVRQAVTDYIDALGKIRDLEDAEKARKDIIKKAKRSNRPKVFTEEEAEQERSHLIARQNSKLAEIERFFHSDWYAEICDIDGDYMIARAKEKFESRKEELQKES